MTERKGPHRNLSAQTLLGWRRKIREKKLLLEERVETVGASRSLRVCEEDVYVNGRLFDTEKMEFVDVIVRPEE